MKKVVREISVRHKKDKVRVVGYSSSDRGTKIVNSHVVLSAKGKSSSAINDEVRAVIANMLAPQLEVITNSTDIPS